MGVMVFFLIMSNAGFLSSTVGPFGLLGGPGDLARGL